MSPHLHKNWLCERLFYFNYDTGRCLVTVPFPESALIVLFVIKGGIQSVLFYHSPSWSGERKRRLWRTAGRFLTLCNRTRSWASLHVDLSHLHVTVNRKKKELVFVLFRVYFGSLPLLSYWIRVQNLLQCTISPRDFLKRFSFCFLSVGGFGRYKLGKAVRGGDWGFQTDRDKADLQYSALRLPRNLRRLAHPFGRPQPHGLRGPDIQNLGELRGRQAAASAPRTAPEAASLPSPMESRRRRSLCAAGEQAGPWKLRHRHPVPSQSVFRASAAQTIIETRSGPGVLLPASLFLKEEVGGWTRRSMYFLLPWTGFLLTGKQPLNFLEIHWLEG